MLGYSKGALYDCSASAFAFCACRVLHLPCKLDTALYNYMDVYIECYSMKGFIWKKELHCWTEDTLQFLCHCRAKEPM